MTFSCKNHDFDTDTCRKLKGECIQGRPGCLLEGKFKLTKATQERIDKMELERKERLKKKK